MWWLAILVQDKNRVITETGHHGTGHYILHLCNVN